MMNEINKDSHLPKMLNTNLYYKYIKLLLRRTNFVAKLVDTYKVNNLDSTFDGNLNVFKLV